MSSCPELPVPKPQIPLSKSEGTYPLVETLTETIHSSDIENSSYHSSSVYSDYTTTYSASAIGAKSDVYATTSDTLGMIETPWSTESWQSRLTHVSTPRYSPSPSTTSETAIESVLTLTAFTIEPKSSVSCGVKTPSLLTLSADTWQWTCLNSVSTIIANTSFTERGKAHNVDSLDTISSWTLQSFTSTGVLDEEAKVRVKYPWSPRTVRSDSTCVTAYPSSVSVEPQSTATIPSAIPSQTDFKRLIPVNYLVLDTMHRIFKNP